MAGHDANGKAIRKNVLGKTQAEVWEKLKRALETCKVIDVSKAEYYSVECWDVYRNGIFLYTEYKIAVSG